MMRSIVAAIMCFAAGYFAITWYRSGGPLPVPVATVRPLQPSSAIPTFAQSVEASRNKVAIEQQSSQSDNDPQRNELRLAAMQAANAYTQSPCDATMKANLVKALTGYTGALADKAGCTSWGCNNEARADVAFEMFNTPLDHRVREAVQEAFEQGGITTAEFPAKVQVPLVTVTRSAGDPVSACSPERAGRERPRTQRVNATDTERPRPATDTPRKPVYASTPVTNNDPWGKNEAAMIKGRESARKSTLEALYLPSGAMCSTEGRKRLIDAIIYYYGQRLNQERTYKTNWGEAGGNYIKQAWDTPEDARVLRMTQEIYGRGFFKLDEIRGAARERVSTVLANEKPGASACPS